MLVAVAAHSYIHVFRAVLRCAKSESVKTERVQIALAFALVIFSACVKLAEYKLPVVFFLFRVPVERDSAPVVLNLNGIIIKARDLNDLSVAFLCFVY